MHNLLRDLNLAARQLRLAPGYSLAAIATLALAIGASTAIFSAVYAVLLKPMPIREPQQLVVGWGSSAALNMRVIEMSYLDIQDIGTATPEVGAVASIGSSAWTVILDGEGEPVKLPSIGVSGHFFELIGAIPQLGRTISPDDDRPASAPVVVISHDLWTRQFGSDPNIVGRTLRLDDQLTEVIGVMPAAFNYPRGTAMWQAIAPVLGTVPGNNGYSTALRNVGVLFMIGRLRPGVTPQAAQDAWTRANAQLQAKTRGPKYDIAVTPFLDYQIGPARRAMWVLFGAVGILLLIACANVSGLMLTRVSLRAHGDAIRRAIGGGRLAIARLWAAETVWLTMLGGALGLLACRGLIGMIIALAPDGIPRLDEVTIDLPVALFSIAVLTIATFLCGLAPIRHAGTVNVTEALNDGTRTITGGRSNRARSSLLVAQIGLAVVLLVAAGLVVRSFSALQSLDFGFNHEAVLRLKVEPRDQSRPINTWIEEFVPQIEQLPEVESVGAVYLTPMELGTIGQGTWAIGEGQPETPEQANRNPIVNYQAANAGYFRTMKIPLISGRLFDESDRENAPRVALISESTAAAFFPGQNPVGKRIKAASFNANQRVVTGVWRTIVGVVGNVRDKGMHEIPLNMYDPPAQSTVGTITSLTVRMKPGREQQALAAAAAIQAQARQRDPRVLVSGIGPMSAVVNKEIAPWRFSAWVFSLFAALAFALSMLGLFSVVSLDVTNRRREFAIRMALGATSARIAGGVFRSAGVRAGVGLATGLALAAVASRSLETLLFGVRMNDAATYGFVVALVTVVVAIASYLPARRAAVADPLALLHRS
ncbi:MAG: ABC transporter permease [Cyanobacteria bacterium]|nr:ABC transporter permease [Cyanobacteriota bacterium]